MSRNSDFVRLILIAKLSSTKNTEISPPLALACFQCQEFVDNTLIGAERIESPKNPVTVQNSQP